MSGPITYHSEITTSKYDIAYSSFRGWLTPIHIYATTHPDPAKPPETVGKSFGFLIRRNMIRRSFHKSMEPPSDETLDLAVTLFDRYGQLKKEIIEHPVRKGSAVWNEELDEGNFVLIETVEVDKNSRRKGIGTQLVLLLLQNAMALASDVQHAFACPIELNSELDMSLGKADLSKEQERALIMSKRAATANFFRSLKFRRVGITHWFALSRDENHSSRRLLPQEDHDPPVDELTDTDTDDEDEHIVYSLSDHLRGQGGMFVQTKLSESESAFLGKMKHGSEKEDRRAEPAVLKRRHPLHYAVKALEDEESLKFVQAHAKENLREGLDLDAINGHGDTVLHVAAKKTKVASIAWIVNSSSGPKLGNIRNNEGYTPLEALQAQLEAKRVGEPYGHQRMILNSDKFDGFDANSVTCLLQLAGIEEPTVEEKRRAKYGCSCGKCVDGFLSPRMLTELRYQAKVLHEMLQESHGAPKNEGWWYRVHKDLLKYLPEQLKPHFRKSRTLQKIFMTLIGAIATSLADDVIPYKAIITKALSKASVWSQINCQYFQRGGTVAAAMEIVIDFAKKGNAKAGFTSEETDGDDNGDDSERLASLPKCRNDDEFEFVRRQCIDDAPAIPENRGLHPVETPWIPHMMRMLIEGRFSQSGAQ